MIKRSLILFSLFFLVTAARASEPVYQKGIVLASEGKFEEAKKEFSEAVKASNSDYSSQGALQVISDISSKKISQDYALVLFKSMQLLYSGAKLEAVDGFKKAISLNAGYPKAYNVIGVIYASEGKMDLALENLKKAVEVDSGYAEGYYNLASLYQSLSKTDEAIDNFKRYVLLRPSAVDGRINLSLAYASKAEYDEAVSECREVLKINPECAEAYYNMGLSYFMLDEYAKSKESLVRARELYRKDGNETGLAAVAQYLDKFGQIEAGAKGSINK
jgi:tetratricopeptide (TPR) repeat protein